MAKLDSSLKLTGSKNRTNPPSLSIMIKPCVPVGLLKSRLAAGASAATTTSARSNTEIFRDILALLLQNFHHVIADRLGNFLEPVRHACRDSNNVALGQMTGFATVNVGTQPLAGFAHLPTDHRTAGDEGRFAVHDVKNVGLFFVNFHLTRSSAVGAR